MYPATYNFRDDENGTSDTDIEFIDSVVGDDSNPIATIIALEDSHRKIIKFTSDGDNGKYYEWFHNFSSAQSVEEVEFWVKFIDNGTGQYHLRVRDASTLCIYLIYNNTNNLLYIYHAATSTTVGVSADTWTHIKFKWDTGTDHQWVWVNGVSIVSDVVFYNSKH